MHKVIFDMDSVGDDIMAIYFAALHPDLKVLGITAENGACGSMEQALNVAINSLEIAGRADIHVYAGIERPFILKTKEEREAPVFFGQRLTNSISSERLKTWNAPRPKPKTQKARGNAVDFIIDTIKANPGEINLVATGPLTNIGYALLQAPEIAAMIKHCYIMGGVFRVPGNMTPVVEYNIWADPEAAKITLQAGMPLTMIPLDVCETNAAADSMLLHEHLPIFSKSSNPVAQDISRRFSVYIDIWKNFWGFKGFPMDDVIALAVIIDPKICSYLENIYVDVELEGKLTRGQTIAFEMPTVLPLEIKHTNSRVANKIDGKRFMDLFIKTVTV